MTHTPGPWKMRDAEVIVIGGGFDIGIVAKENGNVSLIAEVYEVVNQSGRKADVKANAALIARAPELQAESDRRLALLRRWNKKRVKEQERCSFCGEYPTPVYGETPLYGKREWRPITGYKDNHADYCELAEELK